MAENTEDDGRYRLYEEIPVGGHFAVDRIAAGTLRVKRYQNGPISLVVHHGGDQKAMEYLLTREAADELFYRLKEALNH